MVLSKLTNYFKNQGDQSLSNQNQIDENIEIDVDWTPNPNALKFVTPSPVKLEGHSTYRSPVECGENQLAAELFKVRGVDQIHFFDNSIVVTKFSYQDWEVVEEKVIETIKQFLPSHDPDYFDPDPEAERRRNLSPELLAIEEILDKTIRPGLQGDGGDIKTVSYQDNILLVQYLGACGTCPSSTAGTLEAIRAILRDEYNPDIEVYIQPEY